MYNKHFLYGTLETGAQICILGYEAGTVWIIYSKPILKITSQIVRVTVHQS